MPRAKRDRIERLDELQGFLHQSNISDYAPRPHILHGPRRR